MRDFAIVRIGERYGLMACERTIDIREAIWEVLYTVCEIQEAKDLLFVCRNSDKIQMEVMASNTVGRKLRIRVSLVRDEL